MRAILNFLVDKPLAIFGILACAVVISKVGRRLVKLLVRRLGWRRAHRGPGMLRRHTPTSLLDTGELVSTRTMQRIEALAAALAGATSFLIWLVALIPSSGSSECGSSRS
jgi:hypothetical protein